MTVYNIDCDTASRSLNQAGLTYSTVRGNAVSKTPEVNGIVGQWMYSIDAEPYKIGRQALIFDTSSIPKSETITSVILRFKCKAKECDTDFNFVILMGDPQHPGNPVVIQDYAIGSGVGVDGDYNDIKSTSSFAVEDLFDVTLNKIGFLLINKGGETRIYLESSRDVAGNEPAPDTDEYIEFYDASTESPPILIVTTTPPVESSGTTFEFLSDLLESVSIGADETPRDFPDIIVPALPDGYNIYSATMFMKCRMIQNDNGSINQLNGDQNIIIQKGSGALIVCMNLKDNMFPVDANAVSDGVTLYSDIDISAVVDGDGTYSLKIQEAHADYDSLYLKDVQVGLRIVMKQS